jgi:PKD repeat protein
MHSIITGTRPAAAASVWVLTCVAILTVACDRMPLLAPQSSKITVSSNSSVVQSNGVAEIRATVIEQGGTPVQNGTTVTFTTNLGALSPTEARTVNGVATVQFVGNGQSGTATINALSGGVAAEPPLELKVGAAAATVTIVTANPTQIPAGGVSSITATVTDDNGTPLSGVLVSFSTDTGTLSSSQATTSSSGQAQVSLSATRDAIVTATAGTAKPATVTVRVSTTPDLTIASSTTTPIQRQPVTFTVTVTGSATTTDPFQSIVVDFGDGSTSGPLSGTTQSVSHVYDSAGTYTVTATGTTAGGTTKRATTVITVAPRAPLNFTMSATPNPTQVGTPTNFSVVFQGTTVPPNISRYEWSFGDGSTATTTGQQTNHVYTSAGTRTARVTVRTTDGNSGSGQTQIVVAP